MNIFVIGGGGFSAEVLEALLLRNSGATIGGIYDDDTRLARVEDLPYPYLGTIDEFLEDTPRGCSYVLAIGDNLVREQLDERLMAAEKLPVTVVHPSAVVSPTAELGAGSYIAASSFIGPHVKSGRLAIVNVGASIGHNAILGDYVQVCPGARISGFVVAGTGSFFGSNSSVAPGVKLGKRVKLAANSFAMRPLPDNAFAVGVPAKLC